MPKTAKKLKLVYLTPALYMAGGVERVLTLKANYFAEHYDYDITIILTEGKDKPFFYPLSPKIKVINLDINFEELWTCSFIKKIFVYLKKQRKYKKLLSEQLMQLHPDITVSLLRREINFLNSIHDGSKKVGELHINRANYRNFNTEQAGVVKRLFAKIWSGNLLGHLKQLDKLVVLTERDQEAWDELDNVAVIPDPLSLQPSSTSPQTSKRVVAVARYSHEKGIDLLLQTWALVEKRTVDWRLDVYGDGDRNSYEQQAQMLGLDKSRYRLHERTVNVEKAYTESSLFVLSSRFEGFGMVIVEAMACALPVVAFDCPWGPRSIICEGKDGLLVESGNVQEMADALVRLMADEPLRRLMGEAGIKNVQRFSIEKIAERWKVLFESL